MNEMKIRKMSRKALGENPTIRLMVKPFEWLSEVPRGAKKKNKNVIL
jgi:hypothetical protein